MATAEVSETETRTIVNDFVLHVATANGSGSQTSNMVLLRCHTPADCLDQGGHGIDALRSPEPDFFVLGSKSYGRNNTFLLKVGFEQVDDVFAHLRAR